MAESDAARGPVTRRGRRRSGALALLLLLVLMALFAAAVTWVVTGPVRDLRQRREVPGEAPRNDQPPASPDAGRVSP